MKYPPTIPSAIQEAHTLVVDSNVCVDVGDLKARKTSEFYFSCTFKLPHPNSAGLSELIKLNAFVSNVFPYKPIDFFPANTTKDLFGFSHQDAETGKLCLQPEQEAPCNAHRLVEYVKWAHEWLLDAANNTLLKTGDPYELPDFSRKLVKDPPPTDLKLFTEETVHSFHNWEERIGQTGIVEICSLKNPHGLFVGRFLTDDSKLIRESNFSLDRLSKTTLRARWLILPSLVTQRHCPAQQYEELLNLCNLKQISLQKILKKAWVSGSKSSPYSVLLVGFPIPDLIGGNPVELHWQPLLIPNKKSTKKKAPRSKGKRDAGQIWNYEWNNGHFAKKKPLHWGRVENLSRERMYARGSLPHSVCEKNIALVGCGALGSIIAEVLCRAGVRSITLFDEQSIEFGNLCRHTLDGRDIGRMKSSALADRLRVSNMTTQIVSYPLHIPWEGVRKDAESSLEASDILIDCSTDHSAFLWMSDYAKRRRKRLASLFINQHSTLLTLVLSGKQTSAKKVYRSLMNSIEQNTTPVNSNDYFSHISDEIVLPGIGCWHATFPAVNSHIWSLAVAALEQIVHWLEQDERCDGCGILLRRNDGLEVGAMIETISKQLYR